MSTILTEPATVSSGALSMSVTDADRGLRILALTVSIDIAPTSAGSLVLTNDNAEGADYDCILDSTSMITVTDYFDNGGTDASDGWIIAAGDSFEVDYTNPDNRTVSAVCYYTEDIG